MKPKAYVSEQKKEEVKQIKNLIKRYPCFGIIDLTSLPSSTLQQIRHKIKKHDVIIFTTKKSLISIAINDFKDEIKNISELLPVLENSMPALIFTSMNPFKLALMINKSKTSAFAKPGQIAPHDIIIPAGPTKFTPGPVIGELGAVGIKTIIQEGKITIKDDINFVKQGEVIDKKKSEILTKLGIEPMEVEMNLISLYEKGKVYGHDILGISEDAYFNRLNEAHQNSFNLAVFINYTSKDTMETLIKKAYMQGKALASKANIEFSEEIITQINESQESSGEKKHSNQLHEKKDTSAVGYTEEAVEKASEILKQLQDQKIKENRT